MMVVRSVLSLMVIFVGAVSFASAPDCKKTGPKCTLIETLDREGSRDYCASAASAKGLHGCIKITRNIPEHEFDESVYLESGMVDLDEEVAVPGRYTWQCYACPFPQPPPGPAPTPAPNE